MTDELLVKDLGEHGLLERLQRFCPVDVVGDDGAILAIADQKSLVVTTDVLVDRVHFSDRTTSPFDVGWRAVAANLSDLAAMGAKPIGITVGLSLPGSKPVSWVESVYQGMSACLKAYQTPLVGGDICRSTVVSLAITALGEVLPQRAICRHQARPGDAIVITGLHGLSRGGLELLLNFDQAHNLTRAEQERLIKAHQRPQPRLDVMPYLREIPESVAIAGMDSSDGLADAIQQICQRSGVGAIIERSGIQVFSGLTKLAGKETAWSWVLNGGEDFELVLCLPQFYAIKLVEMLGNYAAIIGTITANTAIQMADSPNLASPKLLTEFLNQDRGFQHF
ncbi:thiamine-phosphate kinase [Pleurocapsa sp. CCALA 161]|uniref:thiamine-phosphate kinase n=1 Tax=Pleurocapsa sp. CCALA 161 TaxID=2107688 RepID=UPI000D06E5ED|nr:thiamine-phosphate kinase [Pleurocapsa sp. CCALA 161]PSB12699.1 thiamine-phosphate kinase [Pleurocapsa sp. CCALA 161]